MLIDISPADLKTVRQILQEQIPRLEVRAFGSRVSWTACDTSDLDLVLMTKKPLNIQCEASLQEAFTESNLPFRVDLVDWASTHENFQRIIEKEYVVVQEDSKNRQSIGSEWRNVALVDCADLIRQSAPLSEVEENTPCIDLKHMEKGSLHISGKGTAGDAARRKNRFQRNDILFGRMGPSPRKVVMAPFDGICSTEIWVIRAKQGVDQKFLFYSLASQSFVDFAASASDGTTRAKWDYISQHEIQLPPLPKQRAIADVLCTLDDKIRLNRNMNETLEVAAYSLFKSWFINFDPVRAKTEGHPTGLPQDIDCLFPDSFQTSEIGEIPTGWKVNEIGKLIKCVGGGTPSTKNDSFWAGGKNSWATPKDLSDLKSPFLLNTKKKITDAGVSKISSKILPPNTVLMSSRAPVGYLAVSTIPISINQGFIALKENSEFSFNFILNWCKSNLSNIKNRASGTTFDEINKASFRSLPCVVPSDLVRKEFQRITDPIYRKIISNLQSNEILANIRNTLLPKLLSGNL